MELVRETISLHPIQPHPTKQTIPKIKPLPELIGAYKTTVSKRIHQAGDLDFKWQESYYDHIIRNNKTLDRIINYIQKNPENWLLQGTVATVPYRYFNLVMFIFVFGILF